MYPSKDKNEMYTQNVCVLLVGLVYYYVMHNEYVRVCRAARSLVDDKIGSQWENAFLLSYSKKK